MKGVEAMSTSILYLIGQNNHHSARILKLSATVLAVLLFLPVQVMAGPFPGAIFTTTVDGVIVNENVRYGAKEDVILMVVLVPTHRQKPLGYPRETIISRSLIPAERIYCRRIIFPVAGSM
jgi:hypothetical protein